MHAYELFSQVFFFEEHKVSDIPDSRSHADDQEQRRFIERCQDPRPVNIYVRTQAISLNDARVLRIDSHLEDEDPSFTVYGIIANHVQKEGAMRNPLPWLETMRLRLSPSFSLLSLFTFINWV